MFFNFLRNIIIFFYDLIFGKRHYLSIQSNVVFTQERKKEKKSFINSILVLKSDVSYDEFSSYIIERIKNFIPFKSKIVSSPFIYPYYEVIENFDYKKRIFEETLKEGTDEELYNRLDELFDEKYNQDCLYSFRILHGYNGNQSVVVIRVHHCICDGTMGVKLLFHLTDRKTEYVPPSKEEKQKALERKKKRMETIKKPSIFFRIWSLIKFFFVIVLQPKDPKASVFGHRGGTHGIKSHGTFNIGEVVYIDDIKQVSKKLNCTFNDVIESILASGIRKFMIKHGTKFDKESLKRDKIRMKTVTWVNMRGKPIPVLVNEWGKTKRLFMKSEELTVNFGTIFHDIPYNIESDVKRVKKCNEDLSVLLSSPEPAIVALLLELMGILFPFITRELWSQVGYKISVSTSNVPGPQHIRNFCGKEIQDIAFYTMPEGTLSQMITVMSYNGKITFCVNGIFDREKSTELHKMVMEATKEHLSLIK